MDISAEPKTGGISLGFFSTELWVPTIRIQLSTLEYTLQEESHEKDTCSAGLPDLIRQISRDAHCELPHKKRAFRHRRYLSQGIVQSLLPAPNQGRSASDFFNTAVAVLFSLIHSEYSSEQGLSIRLLIWRVTPDEYESP